MVSRDFSDVCVALIVNILKVLLAFLVAYPIMLIWNESLVKMFTFVKEISFIPAFCVSFLVVYLVLRKQD